MSPEIKEVFKPQMTAQFINDPSTICFLKISNTELNLYYLDYTFCYRNTKIDILMAGKIFFSQEHRQDLKAVQKYFNSIYPFRVQIMAIFIKTLEKINSKS